MFWTFDQLVSYWTDCSLYATGVACFETGVSDEATWLSRTPIIVNAVLIGSLLQRTSLNSLNAVDTLASVESLMLGAVFQYILLSDLFSFTHNPAYIVFLLVAIAVEAAVGMLVLLCSVNSGISIVFSDK